jgi:succinate--hydroxymethylglutarate CoA-transferase
MSRKSLTGIRVLDFTRLFAGPFCTMLLGDLGADVVKIEAPEGDPIRHQGPPFHHGHSMSYLAVNRNKRSIVLDFKVSEAKALAKQLAGAADVIVENFRPGVMDRLGLGYDALAASNPRLVYASMSGMGADGPDRDLGAFDLTIQAEGGYMSITGERDGAPIKLGTSAFDLICGQYAMGAIVTALLDRERTGRGQRLETSLFESEITFLVDAAMEYFLTGRNREKWGSEHAAQAPYQAFQSADGWVVIGAGMQKLFESLLKVLGRLDLLQDPRFANLAGRVQHRAELQQIMKAEIVTHGSASLIERLRAEGVPCAPVNNMEQVFTHRQALHRGMVQHVEHPDYGRIPVIGPAVKYSDFDVADGWQAPPALGEHTGAVLSEWLGLDEAARERATAPRSSK